MIRLTVVGGSILSGIALILLGIAIFAGGMYFYRRAANLRAIMPGTIRWGSGLLLVQGFLKYLGALLAISGHPVTQGPLEATFFELALGTTDVVFAAGLYNRKRWAWMGALGAQGIGAAVAIFVEWPALSSILALTVYPLVVLVLLSGRSARSWVALSSATLNSEPS